MEISRRLRAVRAVNGRFYEYQRSIRGLVGEYYMRNSFNYSAANWIRASAPVCWRHGIYFMHIAREGERNACESGEEFLMKIDGRSLERRVIVLK